MRGASRDEEMRGTAGRYRATRAVVNDRVAAEAAECFFSFHVCHRRLVRAQIKYRVRTEKPGKEGERVDTRAVARHRQLLCARHAVLSFFSCGTFV